MLDLPAIGPQDETLNCPDSNVHSRLMPRELIVRTGLDWRDVGIQRSDSADRQLALHLPARGGTGVGEELLVAEPILRPGKEPIEVVPVVVLSQVFPARPSSIPDIRNFVRHCLAESPLTEEGTRQVSETVFRALLDAAGPTGSINVAFRIFPEHVEVDVLHSDTLLPAPARQPRRAGQAAGQWQAAGSPAGADQERGAVQAETDEAETDQAETDQAETDQAETDEAETDEAETDEAETDEAAQAGLAPSSTVRLGGPGQPATFAEWMSVALRREGLTQEAAARQLGVSVKTVSRWVGGSTEPRMRDLRRIQEVFGILPLP